MSYKRVESAMRLSNIPASERLVLMALASFENDESGQCNPSHETIARTIGMSRTLVSRRIKKLEKTYKVISQERTGRSSSYVFLFPKKCTSDVHTCTHRDVQVCAHRDVHMCTHKQRIGIEKKNREENNQETTTTNKKNTGCKKRAKGRGGDEWPSHDEFVHLANSIADELTEKGTLISEEAIDNVVAAFSSWKQEDISDIRKYTSAALARQEGSIARRNFYAA